MNPIKKQPKINRKFGYNKLIYKKILINDSRSSEERYRKIFSNANYEDNNLIFVHSYEECKTFFENHLEKGHCDLDLIITNNIDIGENPFKASSLLILKNTCSGSFSKSNFRISSIPIILYSSADDKTELQSMGFNAIIKNNEQFDDPYLTQVADNLIRKWRENVFDDLNRLGLDIRKLNYFKSEAEQKAYVQRFARNYERTFYHDTMVVSKEFIINPQALNYDWARLNMSFLGKTLEDFGKMFRYHQTYDKYKNITEQTVIHKFLLANTSILTRDVFINFHHETPLIEHHENESQRCDFILEPQLPGYQNTTFLEIKKENVQLFVNKTRKRPRFSSDMSDFLTQITDYKYYAESPDNSDEMKLKLGYGTTNFSYTLLAGRLEEKLQIQEVFDLRLGRHYPGIEVLTYEDYENLYYNYIEKFSRLNVQY